MRAKIETAKPWVAFVAAVIGGGALMVTVVGLTLGAAINMISPWVAGVLVGIAILTIALDLLDLKPDRPCLIAVMLLPSLTLGVGGDAGRTIRDWASSIAVPTGAHLNQWLGSGSMYLVASLGVAAAFMIHKRSRGGAMRGGMPAGMRH